MHPHKNSIKILDYSQKHDFNAFMQKSRVFICINEQFVFFELFCSKKGRKYAKKGKKLPFGARFGACFFIKNHVFFTILIRVKHRQKITKAVYKSIANVKKM